MRSLKKGMNSLKINLMMYTKELKKNYKLDDTRIFMASLVLV